MAIRAVGENDPRAVVETAVRDAGPQGATSAELSAALAARGTRISIREFRATLAALVADDVVLIERRPTAATGRPPKVYVHRQVTTQPLLFSIDDIRTSEELAREFMPLEEIRRLKEEHGLLADLTLFHHNCDRLVEAVRTAAPSLAEEDPVVLLVDFARWAVERLRSRRAEAITFLRQGVRQRVADHEREIEAMTAWIHSYFRDIFRLHRGVGPEDRVLEIANLERMLDPRLEDDEVIFFDPARAEDELRRRIVGDRVVMLHDDLDDFIVDDGRSVRLTLAATDASMIPFTVRSRPAGSYELPEKVVLFTGAAAQLQVQAGLRVRLVEHDLDLEFLKARDETQAAEQGWMMTETIQDHIGEGHARYAISAAQEFRQYRRDTDVLLNRVPWRGAPGARGEPVDVLVRDGRLFPLVHRIRDYEAAGLYGRIVRNEVQEFHLACRAVVDQGGYVVYGGFVKQAVIHFLAPLVLWYCRERMRMGNVPEQAIVRPPLGDNVMAYCLLSAVAKAHDARSRAFVSTFLVLRRYSDVLTTDELPRITGDDGRRGVRVDDEDDWRTYFEQRLRERTRRYEERIEETPPLHERDYVTVRHLAHRVGLLMGFASPADGRFPPSTPLRLPRVEMLVDLTAVREDWEGSYRRLLAAFTEQDSFVPDDDHPDGAAVQLIIPQVCREAHRAAVFADRIYKSNVERRLVDVVREIEGIVRRRS